MNDLFTPLMYTSCVSPVDKFLSGKSTVVNSVGAKGSDANELFVQTNVLDVESIPVRVILLSQSVSDLILNLILSISYPAG